MEFTRRLQGPLAIFRRRFSSPTASEEVVRVFRPNKVVLVGKLDSRHPVRVLIRGKLLNLVRRGAVEEHRHRPHQIPDKDVVTARLHAQNSHMAVVAAHFLEHPVTGPRLKAHQHDLAVNPGQHLAPKAQDCVDGAVDFRPGCDVQLALNDADEDDLPRSGLVRLVILPHRCRPHAVYWAVDTFEGDGGHRHRQLRVVERERVEDVKRLAVDELNVSKGAAAGFDLREHCNGACLLLVRNAVRRLPKRHCPHLKFLDVVDRAEDKAFLSDQDKRVGE
mmetsp:Transcript_10385/g.26625  ORF Transcript_10385/g.26625 Transcript_10385/m.26625 type:complete len:277 (+) Transcript_10385:468-1298(+)